MRRDWSHKEPSEMRWAKPFFNIQKNAYYVERLKKEKDKWTTGF